MVSKKKLAFLYFSIEKWIIFLKLVKNHGFDEYMAGLGVSWALRKAGAMASGSNKITKEGDDVRIASTTTVKSR